MRRLGLGVGAAVVLCGAVLAWWRLSPRALGLAESRMVLVSGEVTVDQKRARVAQPLGVGGAIRTGSLGSACFGVHAARVCLGAGTEAHLASLDERSATVETSRGALVVATSREELRLSLPDGVVVVSDGVAAIEAAAGEVTVRALEGSLSVEGRGRPAVIVQAPGAVALPEGARRPAAPTVESHERDVVQVARSWQGSAGAIVEVGGARGRVELDGHDVGRAPASLLLDEGRHVLVVREGPRELSRDALDLRAGQRFTREAP